jgi:SNF2 family DNA or RNA helicase
MGYKRKFREEMLPEFNRKSAPYIIRVEAREVMNLPPCTEVMVECEMLGDQDEIYRKMEKDSVVHITKANKKANELKAKSKILKESGNYEEARKLRKEASRTTAGLRITQMIKLQQICGGYLVDDDGETHTLGSTKMRKLKYLIKKKVKFPLVIFCKYTEERIAIEELLIKRGLSYGAIHGKVKDTKKDLKRTKIIQKFQRGELEVMVCQTKAGGVGVDLYAAQTGIFYSTTFSWIDFDQCKKRIDRRGQVNPTTLFFLCVKNAIDEDIYTAILSKRSVSKRIFKNMKKRITYG